MFGVEYVEVGVFCLLYSLILIRHILQMFTRFGNVTSGSLSKDEIKMCSVQNCEKRIINKSGRE